jgi:hypothetical protein
MELHAIQTLILKNGKNVKGTITHQDGETVDFKYEDGSVEHFKRSAILKIVFKDIEKEEADRIRKEEEKKLKEKEEAKAKEDKKKSEDERLAKEAKDQEEKKKREEALANQSKLEAEKKQKSEQEQLLKKQKEEEENARLLAGTVYRSSIVWRSFLFPGWGQKYVANLRKEDSKFIYYSAGLFLAGLYQENQVSSASKLVSDLDTTANLIPFALRAVSVDPLASNNLDSILFFANSSFYDSSIQKLEQEVQIRNTIWSIFGGLWAYGLYQSFQIPLEKQNSNQSSSWKFIPLLRPGINASNSNRESFYGFQLSWEVSL